MCPDVHSCLNLQKIHNSECEYSSLSMSTHKRLHAGILRQNMCTWRHKYTKQDNATPSNINKSPQGRYCVHSCGSGKRSALRFPASSITRSVSKPWKVRLFPLQTGRKSSSLQRTLVDSRHCTQRVEIKYHYGINRP